MVTSSRTTPARRPGRPKGDSAGSTRDALLVAARRQFAELGYDRTTVRGIAAEAGVDPKMVGHHFGSKQRLFLAVVEPPVELAAVLPGILASDDPPRALAAMLGALMDSPDYRRLTTGLIRATASEPEVAPLARDLLTERMLMPLISGLGSDQPELRASLLASQVAGLVMARFVIGIEPLASLDGAALAEILTPVVRRYLVDPL